MHKALAASLVLAMVLAGCSKEAPKPVVVRNSTVPAEKQAAPPYQPGEKHREAQALIGNEKYQEAGAILQALVADEPGNSDAWNDLSFVQAKLMRYADAAASARTALRLRPDFTYALYNLGWALLYTNDWRAAKEPLEASLKAQPDRPEPVYALGRWYDQNGDKTQAMTLYQKSAAMGYEPAKVAAAYLAHQEKQHAAADEAMARFPQAPPGVIRTVMEGYIPAGATRKLVQVLPVRFSNERPADWAALFFDQTSKYTTARVEVYSAKANGSFLDGYQGSCDISSQGSEFPVQPQVFPYSGGEHLMIKFPGGTVICGLKGTRVTEIYSTKEVTAVSGLGLDVGGKPMRFVPETSQYLPVAQAEQILALIVEVRSAGSPVKTTEGVSGQLNVTGKPALTLAWEEAEQNYGMMIAVKPNGEPAILYTAGRAVMYASPYHIGQVTVPGHAFLAVATHQKNAPNGGDVLVLEYDQPRGTFRQVFHGGSDAAGFTDTDVHTTFKKYRLQGGFDLYTTTYIWNEPKGTFVPGKVTESP